MRREPYFPIAAVLTILFPVLLAATALSDIALCIIGALFLLRSWQARDWAWVKEGWFKMLGFLWLYMIARGLMAEHPALALARALPFIRYGVFAAALSRWTLQDGPTRRRFLMLLLSVVLFSACDGLIQYRLGRDLFMHPLLRDPGAGHTRLTGPFTRPILGAMLAWLAFPVMLPALAGGAKAGGGSLSRALLLVALVMAAIFLSGERAALLLMLMGWLIAACLFKVRGRMLMGGALALAGFIALLAAVNPAVMTRQFASTGATIEHWQQSPYGLLLASDLTLAQARPIFGTGANHFRAGCEALYAGDAGKTAAMCNTHPHNIWLEWLIEEGIIGFALFTAFVFCVFRDSLRTLRFKPADPVFAGFFIALILRLWPFMASTGFFSRWGAPPFWLALGALLVYSVGKGEENAGSTLAVQKPGL